MKISNLLPAIKSEFDIDCDSDSLEKVVLRFAAPVLATTNEAVFITKPQLLEAACESLGGTVVLSKRLLAEASDSQRSALSNKALIFCDFPYAFFAAAQAVLQEGSYIQFNQALSSQTPSDANPSAIIHTSSHIHTSVNIGCDVAIGENTVIMPNVTIYDHVKIGKNCIIHSGTVLGSDGFGFAQYKKKWIKIPQTGTVVIADDVEIGANCTIDRGTLGNTTIGRGTKLDNLVHIGHNCEIGEDCAITATVAMAGSSIIGNRVQMGGRASILGHLSICDDVVISTNTVVSHSIHKPAQYTGFYPIAENAEWEKSAVLVRRLGKMRDELKELKLQFTSLKNNT